MKTNTRDKVIVVNESDEWTGTADKLQAHKEGLLHRAFSVFVLNTNNEMLIQKRADGKYHSAGLWSNACCSHPMPGESTVSAAHRRLQEELGFDCEIEELFTYRYKTDVGNGLIENEYDHIYIGQYDGVPQLNKDEVGDYAYVNLDDLADQLRSDPQIFTTWFRMLLPRFLEHVKQYEKVAA